MMENNQVILLKLNKFLFFTDQQFPILPSSNYLLTSISTFLTAIFNFFISIFTFIFNFLFFIFTIIFKIFSFIFTIVFNFLSFIFTVIFNIFSFIFTFILNFLNFFSSIFTALSNFFTSIPNFFSSIFQHIGQFFTGIPNLVTSLLHKLDEAVPPETRIRILIITTACVAVITLLILYRFFSEIINFTICVGVTCMAVITSILPCLDVTCSGCWGPAVGVFMKAPGTAGLVIRRALFEGAPQAYFAALRDGQLVVFGGRVVFFPVLISLMDPTLKKPLHGRIGCDCYE